LSIIKHVTLQKIVAHDFWYDPRNFLFMLGKSAVEMLQAFQTVNGGIMLLKISCV